MMPCLLCLLNQLIESYQLLKGKLARTGYAEILKLRNQLEESERVYRDTIAKFPDNVVARTGYANLLLKLQRFSEARELLTA